MILLHMGDKGQLVAQAQAALGLEADGDFGPKTAKAVAAFQACKGLIPDGVIGPATWAALPGGGPVLGVDVSHYQGGSVDWQGLAGQGVRFGWAKATQGRGFKDKVFQRNRLEAAAAAVALGAYHFADLGDPLVEADHLLATLGPVYPGELPPVLDLENAGRDWTAAKLQAWASAWLDRVHKGTGVRPVVYTYGNFMQARLGGGAALAAEGWPLWIARYRGAGAVGPGPIGKWPRWVCWQWTSRGHLAGVPGAVDLNWMASAADLAALVVK
jgi:GH25 family lysozyme M1 (1,4-beta-N-acetylmuramidase)